MQGSEFSNDRSKGENPNHATTLQIRTIQAKTTKFRCSNECYNQIFVSMTMSTSVHFRWVQQKCHFSHRPWIISCFFKINYLNMLSLIIWRKGCKTIKLNISKQTWKKKGTDFWNVHKPVRPKTQATILFLNNFIWRSRWWYYLNMWDEWSKNDSKVIMKGPPFAMALWAPIIFQNRFWQGKSIKKVMS